MMVMNRIIRDIVDGSHLSIQEISEETDIPIDRIQDVIDFRSSISVREAFMICDVVGVDLENLLGCY